MRFAQKEIFVNTFVKSLVALAMFAFANFAAADPVVVHGEELKNLIVTDKGTTWSLATPTKTRVSFLEGGALYVCQTLANGQGECDSGRYALTENSVDTKMQRWFSQTGGERKMEIKKDGDKLFMNGFQVMERSSVAILFPPTGAEVSTQLAAKGAAAKELLSRSSFIVNQRGKNSISGAEFSANYEASPLKGTFRFWRSIDDCERHEVKTDYSIDDQGNVVMVFTWPFAGCPNYRMKIDPQTKVGGLYYQNDQGVWLERKTTRTLTLQ